MSTGPMFRFLVFVAIAVGAWGYLNHLGRGMDSLRDDLVGRTRFLIRQAQSADTETLARLTARYAAPAGAPALQKAQFEGLWAMLRAGEPGSVTHSGPAPDASGPAHPRRQVTFRGRDERGQPASVRVDWVQIDRTWYVSGFNTVEPVAPSSS
jgi:hypothetical protein